MKRFIPLFGAASILCIVFGTIYVTVQQAQRHDANYPQIQIAADAAAALDRGAKPASLVGQAVDLNSSLAPFLIIYDKSGHVVTGSGYLNQRLPPAPYGILTAAQGKAYHAVTWQPQERVRIASVTVAANSYYVLSGRSLEQVEANENETFGLALIGGIASLLVLGSSYVLAKRRVRQ